MSYKVSSTSANPNLPVSSPLIDQVLAMADLEFLLRVHPDDVTIVGSKVSSMADLSSGGYAAAQGSDVVRPDYLATTMLSKYPAAEFDGTQYLNITPLPPFDDPFTTITIAKPDASLSGYERIWGNRTTSTAGTNLRFGDTDVAFFQHGAGSLSQSCFGNAYNVIVAAWDGATTIKISVNGQAMTTAATDGAHSTNGVVIGAGNSSLIEPFGGRFKLLAMHTADLFADEDGLATIELYEKMARRLGVAVA